MIWLVFALLGCGDGTPVEPVTPPPPVAPVVAPEPPPLPDPTERRLAASHVLVTWSGASLAPATITRSRAEARALAESLHAKAPADATEFAAFASAHSEGPSAFRGGALGVWLTGTMVPNFERHVAAVQPGAIAPLCETAFGFHIIRREAVIQIQARHVLVSWEGAHQSTETRSKSEARARIEQAHTTLANGTPFSAVAAEYSDDSTAKHGGDLGAVSPGQMVPAFEEVALALDVDAVSEIVETPFGFHIIQRTR